MTEFKIRVEAVSKIFGRNPKAAMTRVGTGLGKPELQAASNLILGLHDVTLNIRAGETFVIMGRSGSGKSTPIRRFNRLIDPTGGRILVDGEDILALSPAALRT